MGMIGEVVGIHPKIFSVIACGSLALAGGLTEGFTSGANTSEHVTQATLNTIELVPGQYCDALIGGDISAKSTKHFPVPIAGSIGNGISNALGIGNVVPDLYNRSQIMTGGLEAAVCTYEKKLAAVPDANGDYNVNITVSPDPKTSDVQLLVFPSPNNPVKYQPDGNFSDVAVGAVLATAQAAGQSIGKNVKTFENDIDAGLQADDYSIGVSAFATKCGQPAVKRLNQANQITANLNTGTAVPHTMQEDIALQVEKQTKTPVALNKIHVTYTLVGEGVANNYTADAVARQNNAKNNATSIPAPSQMPNCQIMTGKPPVS